MSDNSKIEWTDATWNPLRAKNPDTGKLGHHCVKISPACTHCYAAGMNKRLGTGLDYSSSSPAEVYLDEEALVKPLAWKRPRKIFVCSMTDLFADFYTREWIARVIGVAAYCRRHTFQFLTKRAERMYEVMTSLTLDECLNAAGLAPYFHPAWPPENMQFGVTAENQQYADERIPWLLKTPAAVRFVSCEPLLGPIDATEWLYSDYDRAAMDEQLLTPLDGFTYSKIGWVIVGGESGQQARPMHPDWALSLRDQCEDPGVPIFFKQWGEWKPISEMEDAEWQPYYVSHRKAKPHERQDEIDELYGRRCTIPTEVIRYDGEHGNLPQMFQSIDGHLGYQIFRVGKKAAGRNLDGRTWDEFPQPLERIEA